MILEIDNIIRNVKDIRLAILSLEGRNPTAEEALKMSRMEETVNQLEHQTRDLEFDLKNKETENGQN